MFRRLLVICALCLLVPASANAAVKRPARPPLPDPMPQMIDGECPGLEDGAVGCYIGIGDADTNGNVYPRGALFTVNDDRFTKLHELGHAYDATMMDAGERSRFEQLVDLDYLMWTFSYTDQSGRLIQSGSSPAEIFADAYANCRMGHVVASGHAWEAGYNYFPTARQHRQVCGMIARAGRDLGHPVAADGSG